MSSFKFFADQAMTQPVPMLNGLQDIATYFDGIETKKQVVWFGSPILGRVLNIAPGSSDTKIKISVVEDNQAWQASTLVSFGQIVQVAGIMYRCTVGRTTGATAPAWNSAVGTITVDGSARWVSIGAAFDESRFKLSLSENGTYSSFVELNAPFSSGAAVAIWCQAENNNDTLRTDKSDPVIRLSATQCIETAV